MTLEQRKMLKGLYGLVALSFFVVLAGCFAAFAGSEKQELRPVPPGSYVGDDKCLSCHQEKKTFLATAHHLTSRAPTKDSIAGKFSEGENILRTSDPELLYRMDARKDGFYQTAVAGTPPDTVSISERFDVVIGSGRKGQTYLYWRDGDQLFELPVSYWTELGRWVNSPGYKDGVLNFSRPVTPRCVECHASSFESLPDPGAINRFNTSNYILGISCEKCHGPGREHVARQTSRTDKLSGQAILNPAKMSRDRQIDTCALCHGGAGVQRAPAFSFVPGEALKDYIQFEAPNPNEVVDVHGSQVTLLERSRCFRSSNMTCSTCHNVHLPQRDLPAFSKACLSCHKIESCGIFAKRGHKIANSCVDCHMPKQTSNLIVSTHEGAKVQPQVRNHWIKVYPGTNNP
jgi:hypothetical protein